METTWHVNGSDAETRNNASIFILHVSRRNSPVQTQPDLESSGFRHFYELRKHLISPCANIQLIWKKSLIDLFLTNTQEILSLVHY